MTGTQSLIARIGLGAGMACVSVAATSIETFRAGLNKDFDRRLMTAYAASRLGLFAVLFLVLRVQPRGDLMAYYLPEAMHVLGGGLPYRGLPSSYAPLHSYMDAGALLVWRSPAAIILLAILVESLLVPVWLRVGRRLFAEPEVRMAAILYIASPISLQFVAVDGHDNVLIGLLVGVALLCMERQRWILSGAMVALGAVLVKFLPLIFFPAFFLAAARRTRWLLGAVSVLLAGYGAFALAGLPIFSPLTQQAGLKTASTLCFVFEVISGVTVSPRAMDTVLLLMLFVVLAITARALQHAAAPDALRVLVFSLGATTLTLLLFAKKAWAPYLMFVLFPVCLAVVRPRLTRLRVALFGCFGIMAVVAQSVYATVFLQPPAPAFRLILRAGGVKAYVALALQVLLLAGYAWLLMVLIASLWKSRHRPPIEGDRMVQPG